MASYRNDRSGEGRSSRPERGGSSRRGGEGAERPARSGAGHEDLLHTDLSGHHFTRQQFLAGLLCGAGGLLITARLADWQIFNADRYQAEADARRLSSQTLYARRGTIYDRNGTVLASSVECKNVYVNPQLIEKKQRKKAVDTLVEILNVDREFVEDAVGRDTTFVYIKRQVDEEDVDLIAERGIAGIEFEPAIKRVYPNGSLASQVLGIVNVDNAGVSGLEKHYDEVLTGVNGSLVRERALDGSFIAGGAYKKVAAQDGMDIVLGIDVNIQRAAEEAIAECVQRLNAKSGSVMLTDPTTGEIIAACSYPTYDPEHLELASNADLNLRMVTDVYEPGSVFKPFVVAAGIEHKGLTPDTEFAVPAVVKVGDDDVRDADKRSYGLTMTVREMIRRSSNTGLVLIGEKLGADDFDEHVIKDFGFGTSTGIDFPGESLGIIKDRDEYDGASLGAMSFGQALAVEPVQMIRAMSAIANDGVMTTPHFVRARAGEELDWTDGEQRAISAQTAEQVASMMLTVVDDGTGTSAQIPGYEVSGKTGTAERAGAGGYIEGSFMGSFLGFANTRDARAMCYITIDGSSYGSEEAAPVFKKIMEVALPALGIKPVR